MTKKVLLALLLMGLVLVACQGCTKKPMEEVTQSPTQTTRTTDTDGDGGEAGRPGDRGVQSSEEALAALQTIYFDFDKYNLREDAKRALDANAKILEENPGANIAILGHCDERGTNEYNLALGENRAKAARDYLVRLGIEASRVSIISYGEEQPVDFGHDEAAWAKNRRGEFAPK